MNEVDDLPVVRTRLDLFWEKVDRSGNCWEWTGGRSGREGYGCFWNGAKQVRAHRWIFEQAYGPIPPGMLVCHRCDNPKCVRVDHLFLGTYSDNLRDAIRKGRQLIPNRLGYVPLGSRNSQAKLNESEVLNIRKMRRDGARVMLIAKQFGVSPKTIYRLLNGENWAHVAT